MQSSSSHVWLSSLALAFALALGAGTGCYYASDPTGTGDGVDASIASNEFPCEAAKVLATCWSCHGTPVRGGATFSLDKMSDLRAPSSVAPAQTQAARSLLRLRDTASPMPPRGYPRPSDAEIAAFSTWIDNGMPAGTCNGLPDPNEPAPVICTSGQHWTGGNHESPDMNPGLACRACHLRDEPQKAYFFMGTVYPTLHEGNTCYSAVPAGTKVEILDANGAVAVTMQVRAQGNFYSRSTTAGITLPYTARVVSPAGSVVTMTSKQTNGDCNACHTEQGTMSALGRILLPTP